MPQPSRASEKAKAAESAERTIPRFPPDEEASLPVHSPGRQPARLDPQALTELTPAMKRIAYLRVFGLDDPHAAFPELEIGRPLSVEQVADIVGVRRRYVRRLDEAPKFMAEINRLTAVLRSGAKPKAVHRMIALVDSEDGDLALRASKAVLGEEAKGVTVNVNSQTNIAVRPGYVIRAPQQDVSEPVTIEGRAE